MSSVPQLEVADLKARLERGDAFQLLDVREPRELEICRLDLAGTIHIPLGDLFDRAHELSPEGELIVFCRTGTRSAFAVELLHEMGLENAVNLRGGIMAWAEAYDPAMMRY